MRKLVVILVLATLLSSASAGWAQPADQVQGWPVPPTGFPTLRHGAPPRPTQPAWHVPERSGPGAVITVNTTDDELNGDGDCSLREAIQAANADGLVDACVAGSGDDTVVVPAGTYLLTLTGANEDGNLAGDLDILDNLVLTGSGAGATILDGNQTDRVLDIRPGRTVEVDGVTVTHGFVVDEDGGGILNQGNLTVNDSVLTLNTAHSPELCYGGGGLASDAMVQDASVTLNNTQIVANTGGCGGGLSNSTWASGVTAAMTLNGCTVGSNVAELAAGGMQNLGYVGSDSTLILTVANSVVENNTDNVLGEGGGILNQGYAQNNIDALLFVDHSTIRGNVAAVESCSFVMGCGFGGGIFDLNGDVSVAYSTISGNLSSGDYGIGGGIAVMGAHGRGSVTVDHSIISDNTASGGWGEGGGVWATVATVTIAGSTIHDNTATCEGDYCGSGGGLLLMNETQATIETSTLSNNSAWGAGYRGGAGGALYLEGSAVTFSDCTISRNQAGQFGGGVQVFGWYRPASMALVNTTLAGNSAGAGGGGIENWNWGGGATVTFKNSLVAGNSAPSGASCHNADYGFGPGILDSLGNNLEDTDLCQFDQPADLPNTDPLLGPLRDNGGPTWTHALLTGSPAINAGDDAAAPPTDQRGVARPQGPASDIGAFEAEALHVGDILGFFGPSRNGHYALRANVTVHDASHQPAGHVAVDALVWSPLGGPFARTRMTQPATGTASFLWGSSAPGTWRLCAEDLAKDGYIYDANLNDVPACATWNN